MSDKRDLFTTGFKPEDFDSMVIPAYSSNWNELIANHANALLREALAEAQTLYGTKSNELVGSLWAVSKLDNDEYQAKLVAIKPLKDD